MPLQRIPKAPKQPTFLLGQLRLAQVSPGLREILERREGDSATGVDAEGVQYWAWLIPAPKGEFVAIFLQSSIDAARARAAGPLPDAPDVQPLHGEPPGISWTLQSRG